MFQKGIIFPEQFRRFGEELAASSWQFNSWQFKPLKPIHFLFDFFSDAREFFDQWFQVPNKD